MIQIPSNTPKVFDCHIHVEQGVEKYVLPLRGGNIIFNTIAGYEALAEKYPGFHHSLIFDPQQPVEFYNTLIADKKIVALKIHSRLMKIGMDNYPALIEGLRKLDSEIPIIYDAFYYGSDLEFQPNLAALISLIKAFPNRKFIVAHAGGYEVLKYFFHLREFEHVGYDLSFSLQYLADSSCMSDLIKLIRFTPKERIFFGSDFPYANPEMQLNTLLDITDQLEITQQDRDGILTTNWEKFVGITER